MSILVLAQERQRARQREEQSVLDRFFAEVTSKMGDDATEEDGAALVARVKACLLGPSAGGTVGTVAGGGGGGSGGSRGGVSKGTVGDKKIKGKGNGETDKSDGRDEISDLEGLLDLSLESLGSDANDAEEDGEKDDLDGWGTADTTDEEDTDADAGESKAGASAISLGIAAIAIAKKSAKKMKGKLFEGRDRER